MVRRDSCEIAFTASPVHETQLTNSRLTRSRGRGSGCEALKRAIVSLKKRSSTAVSCQNSLREGRLENACTGRVVGMPHRVCSGTRIVGRGSLVAPAELPILTACLHSTTGKCIVFAFVQSGFQDKLRFVIAEPKRARHPASDPAGRLQRRNRVEPVIRCQNLAERIEQIEPDAPVADVARLALLIANLVDDIDSLSDDDRMREVYRDACLRLQMGVDQHAAVAAELQTLAESDPKQFDREQIWILLRAIKVQSQILQLYLGGEPIEV